MILNSEVIPIEIIKNTIYEETDGNIIISGYLLDNHTTLKLFGFNEKYYNLTRVK